MWAPNPGPQIDAIESPAFEVLYGGAAGGGKSELLLGLAGWQHHSVLLLRRTYPELEDSLIPRSHEIYRQAAKYNGSKHVWTFPNGRRIRFGHLEYNSDVTQYQSAAFDLIGFDELTQFTKSQYEYMLSRARTTHRGQRVRIIGCTNPGGEGNDWVMERWAPWLDEGHPDPAMPGELRWFMRDAEGNEVETTAEDTDGISRTFLPASLSDNPYLGDDYRRRLNNMPEPFRSQLLHGDWQAGMTDDAYQVVPTEWIKAAVRRWKEQGQHSGPLSMVGVDVARGGDDKTVLARRYGSWIAPLEKHDGKTTRTGQSVATLIAAALTEGGAAAVDVIGIGASAYDAATESGLTAYPINFAEGSDALDKSGRLRFANKRAEYYWRMREALDPTGNERLCLPDDPELLGDLRAPRWSMKTNGVQIESKEQIKARLGRSPDCGDAVVLSLANLDAEAIANTYHDIVRNW